MQITRFHCISHLMINILSILFEYFIAGIVLLLTDNMAVFGVEW